MTQAVDQVRHHREQWLDRLRHLADQVTKWSEAQGWTVERARKEINEEGLGRYDAPSLTIHVPGGEILLQPVALRVIGGEGRVDLRARPTLARVKLLPTKNGWGIMTDSNVPLRQPWDANTFVQLVRDLIS